MISGSSLELCVREDIGAWWSRIVRRYCGLDTAGKPGAYDHTGFPICVMARRAEACHFDDTLRTMCLKLLPEWVLAEGVE